MKPYYQNEYCTIYNADARDCVSRLSDIELVLTDPPYSSGARRDASKSARGAMLRGAAHKENWFSHDNMTSWGFQWFLRSFLSALMPKVSLGAHFYVFTDWRMTPTVYGLLESVNLRVNHCLVWDKKVFGMGSNWRNQHENIVFASLGKPRAMAHRNRGTVLGFKGVHHAKKQHPTEKPIDLLFDIVQATGMNNILDPFMGVGSTLVASMILKKRVVGIDLSEPYCEIAANRLEDVRTKLA